MTRGITGLRSLRLPLLFGSGAVLGWLVVHFADALQSPAELDVLGWWGAAGEGITSRDQAMTGLLAALSALVVVWLLCLRAVSAARLGERTVMAWGGLWAAPFVLGPPIASRDIYAYVAQGRLLQRGVDPYSAPTSALGHSAALLAVDPVWRGARAPYGPLALRLEQAAAWAGHGSEVATIAVLRAVAVLSCLVAVAVVRRLSSPPTRAARVWLVLSPLTLLQLVGAVHFEAELSALLLLSTAAALREKWLLAALLCAAAVEIKATALVAAGVLMLAAWSHGAAALRRAAAGIAAGLLAGCLLFIGDPFGWVPNVMTPFASWSPSAPASQLFLVLAELLPRQSPDGLTQLLVLSRVTVAALAAVLGLLVLRSHRRGLLVTTGLLSLLVVAAAPVAWPWYAAPFAILLGLGDRSWRRASAVLGSLLALFALPLHVHDVQRVAFAADAVTAVVFVAYRRRGHLVGGSAPRWA